MDVTKSQGAQKFYQDSLRLLKKSKIPFLIGGTFAVNTYMGFERPTKDLDVFATVPDYPKILQLFSGADYKTQITDERFLAKVTQGRYFFDIVFNSPVA